VGHLFHSCLCGRELFHSLEWVLECNADDEDLGMYMCVDTRDTLGNIVTIGGCVCACVCVCVYVCVSVCVCVCVCVCDLGMRICVDTRDTLGNAVTINVFVCAR